MSTISYTEKFVKHYKHLTAVEKNEFRNKMRLFMENPMTPSLRIHKIKGSKNLFEFSVNMDIRVLWQYKGEDIIALIDIGHHNILKLY